MAYIKLKIRNYDKKYFLDKNNKPEENDLEEALGKCHS